MTKIPADLNYTATHEWIKKENDTTFIIGITDHAQHQLGDLVYVELPELKKQTAARKEIAVVESVKTAADIYSPIDGEIIAVNEQLKTAPEKINQDPYGEGWLFKIKASNSNPLANLLDATKYSQQIEK